MITIKYNSVTYTEPLVTTVETHITYMYLGHKLLPDIKHLNPDTYDIPKCSKSLDICCLLGTLYLCNKLCPSRYTLSYTLTK